MSLTAGDEKPLIERARKLFARDQEDEREIRDEAEKDIKFRSGDQWDPAAKAQRESEFRPALTFDKTHVYIQSVANEARQNKPQPHVNPIGGGATTDVAVVTNGILRHIQYRSMADVAYDTALDYSTGSSFSFLRFVTEYASNQSFDQEIRILPVLDPFTIYGVLMPACRGQICRHAFAVETISKTEYERMYGNESGEPQNWESTEWKDAGDWTTGDKVRIAEFWELTEKPRQMRHTRNLDGSTSPIYSDEDGYETNVNVVTGSDGNPLERTVPNTKVTFCKMDGRRVLPGTMTTWVGDSIPIVAVLGQQLISEGQVYLFSLIRFIRDTQRLINIYASAIAEKIGLANRVPYVGYTGIFKDPRWLTANVVNYPYLEVEPVILPDGSLAPIPQREQLEEQITALSQALAIQIDALKSGMGIYDASLGARSNETSGLGINARQQQSNITNFHFADNLNRAQWELCRKIIRVIPKIYDRPGRQVRIVGEDQEHSVVVVNQPYVDPETGKQKTYMLDIGEYDVVVTVGPSFTTARQEGAETLAQFFQAAPNTVQLLGDLWVGSLDYPWSREAARRLKLAAPQNIVNDDQGDQNIPPQIKQQMMQLQQAASDAHSFAQSLHEKLESKQPEIDAKVEMLRMELDFKREQLAVTAAIGETQAKVQSSIALLNSQIKAIQHERGITADADAQTSDQAHQLAMATQAQNAAAQFQQSAQTHQADQATQSQQAQQDLSAQNAQQTAAQSAQDAAAQPNETP